MATGTQDTGCIFIERGQICHKLTESGTTMCPYHNLLKAHREQEKEKRREEKAQPKKPARSVRGYHEKQTYIND